MLNNMASHSKIIGFGHYLPSRVLTNFDFEKSVDTSDEWIKTRTGIEKRHFTEDGETTSSMAIEASKKAIERAGIHRDDINLIIAGTVTGDFRYPSTATLIQKGLGLQRPVPSFDVAAACSGFVYGLTIADAMIKSGAYKTVLVIGAENLSKFTDQKDRNTCVLFGDGAGAAIVQASEEEGIMGHHIAADGNYSHLICFPADGSKQPTTEDTVKKRLHYTKMEGQETFRHAVQIMSSASDKVLKTLGLTFDDISWIVPHQANIRIVDAVAKRLKVQKEKVFTNLDHVGNTSAASIPISLSEMQDRNLLKRGDIVVLCALGSGLAYGSIVFRW